MKTILVLLCVLMSMSVPNIQSQEFPDAMIWQQCAKDPNFNLNGTIVISPDGKYIYSVLKTYIKKIDGATGKLIEIVNIDGYYQDWQKRKILLSPDNKFLFGVENGSFRGFFVQNMENKLTKIFLENKGSIEGFTIDTLNKKIYIGLATTSVFNGDIWMYEYEKEKELVKLFSNVGVKDLTFDHKRNKLYSMETEKIEIFNGTKVDTSYIMNRMAIFDMNQNKYEKTIQIVENKNPNKWLSVNEISPNCGYLHLSFEGSLLLNLENFELSKINIKEFGWTRRYNFFQNDITMISNFTDNKNDQVDTMVLFNPFDGKIYERKTFYNYLREIWNVTAPIILILSSNTSDIIDPKKEDCFKAYKIEKLMSEVIVDNNTLIQTLFPNPTNGLVQIKLNQEITTPILIEISHLNGILVQSISNQIAVNQELQLNLSNLNAGQYFIKVNSLNFSRTFKVIKGA